MPDSDSPFALAVVGAAGSGKSTIARGLARRSGAVYIDKDQLAGRLVDAALRARGESVEERESNDFYRANVMPAEYESVFGVAADNLELGHSVIMDAPFAAYLEDPEFFERMTAGWPSARCFVVRVIASEDRTRERLQARGLARDRVKLDNWDAFWTRWGRPAVSWRGVRLVELENDEMPDLDHVARFLVSPAPV